MYSKSTHNVKVTVHPTYTEESSSPAQGHYVWQYTVCIENDSKHILQLVTRCWQVIDADGFMQKINGKGVIGKQPTLSPNEKFEYTSQVQLSSPSGIMLGSYQMVIQETNEELDIDIPAFSLDIPNTIVALH